MLRLTAAQSLRTSRRYTSILAYWLSEVVKPNLAPRTYEFSTNCSSVSTLIPT